MIGILPFCALGFFYEASLPMPVPFDLPRIGFWKL